MPLSREGLRAALDGDEVFPHHRRADYRRRVEQRLFNGASIDQHLKLINVVRHPRVGDRIEVHIAEYLVDALPQLSDEALSEAAQPLEDLEEHRRNVAALEQTREAVTGLLGYYRSYCIHDLRQRAKAAQDRLAELRHGSRDELSKRQTAQTARTVLQRLDGEIHEIEERIERLRRKIAALEESKAYQDGQQLEPLRELVAELSKQVADAHTRVEAAENRTGDASRELDRARQLGRNDLLELNHQLASATKLSGLCRTASRPPAPVTVAETPLEDLDASTPGDLNETDIRRQISSADAAVIRRQDDISKVATALQRSDEAVNSLKQAEAALDHRAKAVQTEANELASRHRHLTAAKREWREAVRGWAATLHRDLQAAEIAGANVAALMSNAANEKPEVDYEHSRAGLLAEVQALVDHRQQVIVRLEGRLSLEEEARSEAQALVDRLARRTEPELPRFDWQADADHCLADLLDFAPHLTETERAGLEGALQASGLLTARLVGGDAVELANGDLVAVSGERVQQPLSACLAARGKSPAKHRDRRDARPTRREEGEYREYSTDEQRSRAGWIVGRMPRDFYHGLLVASVPTRLGDAVDEDVVAKLLRSISTNLSSSARNSVDVAGNFRLGALRGRHVKERAEFIGVTARRAALARARADAAEQLRHAGDIVAGRQTELADCRQSLAEAHALRDQLPKTQSIQHALTEVRVATQSRRRAEEERKHAAAIMAEAERDERGADDALQRLASTLILPRDTEKLDAARRDLHELSSTLTQCEACLGALHRSLANWSAAVDRLQLAYGTLANERADLSDATSRHKAEQVRLHAIEKNIGAEYETVVAERDRCKQYLREAEKRLRARRNERDTAVEARARAETAAKTAADKLQQASAACESERSSLQAIIETPGYHGAIKDQDDQPNEKETMSEPIIVRSPGADGLRELLDAISELLPPDDTAIEVVPVTADGVRQSLLRRRDALGAGYDAEASQPDPATPLIVEVTGPFGRASLTDSLRTVAAQHRQNTGLLNRKQADALRELLQGMVAKELATKITGAKHLVSLMNQRLRAVTTAHRVGVTLRWRRRLDLDPPTARMIELLAKVPDLRSDEEESELRQALSKRLDEARAEHPGAPYRQIIADTLDYKQWHEMAVILNRDGKQSKLSRRTPLSEGEKKLVTYLPLFAAVAASSDALSQQLRSARDGEMPGIARFILLDDAFAKVSEDNHAQLFGLLVELDLDLIATSERLWGMHRSVPALAITEVVRDAALDAILLEHYRWDGATLERAADTA